MLWVWTQPPRADSLFDAIKVAAARRFGDGRENGRALGEASDFGRSLSSFCLSALAEGAVNLAYRLPWKIARFRRKLLRDGHEIAVDVYDALLHELGTRVEIGSMPDPALSALARVGPVLIVCNHPYPPFDGLSLLSIANKIRPGGVRILVNSNNSLLKLFPDYAESAIPLLMSGGLLGSPNKRGVKNSRFRALRRSISELDSGRCVVVLPAGEGSKARNWGDPIVDVPWMAGVGHVVKHFADRGRNLSVVPAFISGHLGSEQNSWLYQWAAIERPSLLPAALQLALFNAPEKVVVTFGEPLAASDFGGLDKNQVAHELRRAVYRLGGKPPPVATKTRRTT